MSTTPDDSGQIQTQQFRYTCSSKCSFMNSANKFVFVRVSSGNGYRDSLAFECYQKHTPIYIKTLIHTSLYYDTMIHNSTHTHTHAHTHTHTHTHIHTHQHTSLTHTNIHTHTHTHPDIINPPHTISMSLVDSRKIFVKICSSNFSTFSYKKFHKTKVVELKKLVRKCQRLLSL